MADTTPPLSLPTFDGPSRAATKERFYVFLQLACWGGLAVVQYLFAHFVPASPGQADRILATVVQVYGGGLLLSHYGRTVIHRRGWKALGWRALVPRVLVLAALQALVWAGGLYLVQCVVLEWSASGVRGPVFFAAIWVQGTVTMTFWLSLYFFYHLFDRFNQLEIDRLRLVATVKQAELRALKSQLNPHFIFNSLNSLRALIEEDPQRARQAVTQLANLLRYSLKSGQLETVPFEEELKVVADYMALEQVRHEERLRFRLDVPAEALAWPVPPMLLQTLVENAVKYGISARAEGGEIAVVARVAEEALRVSVTNPGRIAASDERRASTGLGLANAAERLRLLAGEKSSLELRAEGPDTVRAEAVIPRIQLFKA